MSADRARARLAVRITTESVGTICGLVVQHLVTEGGMTFDRLYERVVEAGAKDKRGLEASDGVRGRMRNYCPWGTRAVRRHPHIEVDELRRALLVLVKNSFIQVQYYFSKSFIPPDDTWPTNPSDLKGCDTIFVCHPKSCISRLRYPRSWEMCTEYLGKIPALVLFAAMRVGTGSMEEYGDHITSMSAEEFIHLQGDGDNCDPVQRPTQKEVEEAVDDLIRANYLITVSPLKDVAQRCWQNKCDEQTKLEQARIFLAANKGKRKRGPPPPTQQIRVEELSQSLGQQRAVVRGAGRKRGRLTGSATPTEDTTPSGALSPSDILQTIGSVNLDSPKAFRKAALRYRVNVDSITFDHIRLTVEDLVAGRHATDPMPGVLRMVVRCLLRWTVRRGSDALRDVIERPLPIESTRGFTDNFFRRRLEEQIRSEHERCLLGGLGAVKLEITPQDEGWALALTNMLSNMCEHSDRIVQKTVQGDCYQYGINWGAVRSLLKRRVTLLIIRRTVSLEAGRVWAALTAATAGENSLTGVSDTDIAEACLLSPHQARIGLYNLKHQRLVREITKSDGQGYSWAADEREAFRAVYSHVLQVGSNLIERRQVENYVVQELSLVDGDDAEEAERQRERVVATKRGEDILENYLLLLDEHIAILEDL